MDRKDISSLSFSQLMKEHLSQDAGFDRALRRAIRPSVKWQKGQRNLRFFRIDLSKV